VGYTTFAKPGDGRLFAGDPAARRGVLRLLRHSLGKPVSFFGVRVALASWPIRPRQVIPRAFGVRLVRS
jgi:hypothetical protein